MRLQISFALLLLLAMVVFAGCYTKLGHHTASDYGRVHLKHHEGLTKEETGTEHAEEASELEHADDEDSDGYYGRRKRSYRTTYTQPYRYDTYWSPHVAYPYYGYPPVWYYPYRPFYGYSRYYYGYHAPYYRYYPYRNVYRQYHRSGSRYTPLSRRTYKKGEGRLEKRRSRSSRSVTSPKSRSERLRTRDRNKK